MIRLTPFALLFALAACSSESTDAAGATEAASNDTEVPAVGLSDDEVEINRNFKALSDACRDRDADEVYKYFSESTRDHWVRIKGLALHADKATLRDKSMVVQLAVLVMRAQSNFEALEVLDERGMIRYALDNNLLGNQMIVGNELKDLQIDGDTAESGARSLVDGRDLQIRYGFVREDGMWRVDLVPVYTIANEIFAAKRASHGVPGDEEEALYFLVGNATGNAGTPALWTPLSETIDD